MRIGSPSDWLASRPSGGPRPAVFLDRDGVLIENRPEFVRSADDIDVLPRAVDAVRRLNEAGLPAVVVTNQSAVGRGILSLADAERLHRIVVARFAEAGARLDASYMCPHRPDAGCSCRKPKPGMLVEAARELGIDLSRAFIIGDACRDVEAGLAVGCAAILVQTGMGRAELAGCPIPRERFRVAADALDAVERFVRI
ncbi:MAG: HAD family hydrolase [Fimbriimonadaceae bacterium]